jgi:predicted outer membrane repeat protein
VNVLPGTYFEGGLYLSTVTLRGVAGASETIIDAQGLNRVLRVFGSGVLEGLTITGGVADRGAGINVEGAVELRDCVVTNNHATSEGGAMAFYQFGGFPVSLVNTIFSKNSGSWGGALDAQHIQLTATGCLFESNSANQGGAAILRSTDANFTNCLFIRNSATRGGALALHFAGASIEGCTFHGNSAPLGGAIEGTNGAITRTIISFTNSDSTVTCSNQVPFSCCNIFGNSGGDSICGLDAGGNFSLDPLFCDSEGGDFHLDENSPCLPENHPGAVDCGGTIGALGVGCGSATSVDDQLKGDSWGGVKTRYR